MKKKQIKKILESVLFPLLAVAAVLLIWQIAAMATGSRLILPPPKEAAEQLLRYITLPEFYGALFSTVGRSLLSFAAAVVLAAVSAALGMICRPIKLFLQTFISILRSLPTISVILLFIIWTNSVLTPMLVALIVVYPTLYSAIIGGLEGIDKALEETAKIYALPLYAKIFKIYVPLCMPNFLTNASSAISLNLKLVIAAEVLAQTAGGIGLMMQISQVYFETGRLLALTAVVVIVGFILEGLLLLIKKYTCGWAQN